MKKLLQIGAGKIGRSFIAQVFSSAGYEIIFADIDPCLVKSINEAGSYNVIFKSNDGEEKFVVEHVSAIEITSIKSLIKTIEEVNTISISVGKKSLLNLARILSAAIKNRYTQRPDSPVDIILAENVRNAASLLSNDIINFIPEIPVNEYVGFVETSIGKMVPLMTEEQILKDPLAVFAEPYNTLIVDALAFRNMPDDVPSLCPKENMKAWVDRKLFIHNLGHAVLAYQSYYRFPEIEFTWQALLNKDIHDITKRTMLQSASILLAMYPSEFSTDGLKEHIEDLLRRFANKSLGDTIYRVGCDIPRKLGRDDRLMLPVLKAIEHNKEYELILEAWVKGCFFNARNEKGKLFPEDKKFKEKFRENPVWILSAHCNLDSTKDAQLFRKVEELIAYLNKHEY